MAKTANINVRVDPETKPQAEELFSSFGITITDAINIFLNKSIMEGGLLFEMKQPRCIEETEAAMREARLETVINFLLNEQSPAEHYRDHNLF